MELIPGIPDEIGLEGLFRVPFQQFPVLSSVCRRWKHEISSPEFFNLRKTGGFNKPVVVMVQAYPEPEIRNLGTNYFRRSPTYRITICDITTGLWNELPPVPWFPAGLPLFCQVVGVGFNVVVMGGQDPMTWRFSREVSVYNFLSGKWTRGSHMPGCQRSFFACAAASDLVDNSNWVFVAGGLDDDDNKALRSALAYDVASDVWVSLPDMGMKRAECRGVFQAGKFHVIGGYDTDVGSGRFGKSADVYDVAARKWEPVVNEYLIAGNCPRTCFNGGDGKLYMCLNDDVVSTEREGFNWRGVTQLPPQLKTVQITGGCNMLFVIGSSGYGGPHKAYVFNLEGGVKWDDMEVPVEFTGHVQSCGWLNI